MKVGLMIGGLGRGGAERQLVRLAQGLNQRGCAVEIFTYAARSAVDQEIAGMGLTHRSIVAQGFSEKVRQTRRWLKAFEPDVLHAFMHRSSSLAALASVGMSNIRVIGSDLSTATYHRTSKTLWPALLLFSMVDRVSTQTRLNERSLCTLAPWLRGKTVVIRNGMDAAYFQPPTVPLADDVFVFGSVGTVSAIKNPVRLVEAVALLKSRLDRAFRVDWHGRFGFSGDHEPSAAYRQAEERRRALGVESEIRFLGENRQVAEAYHQCHALVHPSVQEGFPNAVVEAMASGLPIVVGRISDLPMVIDEARNGYMFDERDPGDIAGAMQAMMETPANERAAMGERSRELAVRWFDRERFIDEYLDLYQSLVDQEPARVG